MLNKKGFTLIELLCVLVILALITTVASVGIITLSNKSKENLYCTKLELIKSAAKEYGKNHEKELNESSEYYEEYKSLTITVSDLILSGKFTPDSNDQVLNPLDNTSMNDLEIILYLKNNAINVYISNNVCEI